MSVNALKTMAALCVFAISMLQTSPVAAKSCARTPLPASAAKAVPTSNPNQTLFNFAILAEVNYVRCSAGLPPLELARGLMSVADTHAGWMAKRGQLSHRSTIRGQSSVQERVLASGPNVRRGSENIGNLPRYQFGGTRQILVKNVRNCVFTTTSGRAIRPHSYATVANEIVGKWMNSTGHRRNVLDQNVRTIGSAIRFDSRASHCGQFFLSQNFAG